LTLTLLSACGGGGGGGATDAGAPTVTATSPASGATGVLVSVPVTATFSEALNASSVGDTSFTLSNGASNVTGTISYDGTTATFTPAANLAYTTAYTATLTASVKDAAGNSMSGNYTWSFTTGASPDTTAPTVTTTSPANNATGVSVSAPITATFSEAMSASSVSATSFTLDHGVTGSVSYSGTTATLTPSSQLAYLTTYTATVTTAVKDVAGNALANNHTWTFTTTVAPSTVNYSFTNALAPTEISQSGVLGLFDTSLGTLIGATLTLSDSMQTTITLTNNANSSQSIRATGNVSLFYGSNIGVLNTILSAANPVGNLTATTGIQNIGAGQTQAFGPLTGTDTDIYGAQLNAILESLSAPGGGTFGINCQSISGIQIEGGGGQIGSNQTTQAQCGGMIEYVYTVP
jgi:hypothetical protein